MRQGQITLLEREILLYISSFRKRKGYPPTFREIADAVGLKSASSVQLHLEQMERAGFIKRDRYKSRTIAVSAAGRSLL